MIIMNHLEYKLIFPKTCSSDCRQSVTNAICKNIVLGKVLMPILPEEVECFIQLNLLQIRSVFQDAI